MINVRAATAADEPRWRELWAGYNAFYAAKVSRIHYPGDLAADSGSRGPDRWPNRRSRWARGGLSNSVLHESTWAATPICYLEDLFVDPAMRGSGVGRMLLQDLVALARQHGWPTVYWHTRGNNATARRLYDTFTPADDFVRYVVTVGD